MSLILLLMQLGRPPVTVDLPRPGSFRVEGDSAQRSASRIPAGSAFALMPRPGATDAAGAEIVARCGGSFPVSVAATLKEEWVLTDSITWTREAPGTWERLGCVRAMLSTTGAHEREGPEMLGGTSWAQGAASALLHAVRQDGITQTGADVLALLDLRENYARSGRPIVAVIDTAVARGLLSPPVLRACSAQAAEARDLARMRRCASLALARGWDSTWQEIHLARAAFLTADTTEGRRHFLRAVAAARDSLALQEITWHLQWFISPGELEQWHTLPAADRVRTLDGWMLQRDVRDTRPQGARVTEHFRRLDHVEHAFRTVRPKLNAVMNGPYASMGGDPNLWPGSGERPLYRRWQNDFDDRGVIYMRFGEPSRLERDFDRYGEAIETWQYPIETELCRPVWAQFHDVWFDGTQAPTRIGRGCGIGLMTEQDDNGLRDARAVRLAGAFHRLWDPVTGDLVAVLPYAVALGDLHRVTDSSGRRVTVELTARQWDPVLGRWHDTLFIRSVRIPDGSRADLLAGFVVTPTTPTTATWSLSAEQAPDRWGRRTESRLPRLPGDSLRLSDLVLGAASQGMTWRRGSEQVLLGPQGAFDRKERIALFFQTNASQAEPDVRMTIAVFTGQYRNLSQRPALELSSSLAIQAGLGGVHRDLDLSRLGTGDFRIQVTIARRDGTILARHDALLTLR